MKIEADMRLDCIDFNALWIRQKKLSRTDFLKQRLALPFFEFSIRNCQSHSNNDDGIPIR